MNVFLTEMDCSENIQLTYVRMPEKADSNPTYTLRILRRIFDRFDTVFARNVQVIVSRTVIKCLE